MININLRKLLKLGKPKDRVTQIQFPRSVTTLLCSRQTEIVGIELHDIPFNVVVKLVLPSRGNPTVSAATEIIIPSSVLDEVLHHLQNSRDLYESQSKD